VVAELVINSPTAATVQPEIEGQPQREEIKLDEARHTLEMDGPSKSRVVFQVTQVNPMYVTLTPTGAMAGKFATANLTSMTPEDGYRLTHRGFHWISEYPYVQ
jgi:hypothetical protein